ncbi:serine/threonine-protein kinase [Herbiconiux sp. KACC 21604]|uniref:serine/threonine-protein kinase n=1 Tax=unclassified Herbiconiux TaxID=2618217 RepID=UPI0014930093|nr:serine/threonine-protein kinase [Herbiconiux sp. SALV-R1]QJU53246.1 serine/threonine protein kinase [Herbiconiux sp. SALV-R1]WPO88205.1 serine/threonine-protein kinase [Herbiconiux sp. KACC 21604]
MARRLPSAPPALPGFSPVRVLGSGGFADVFLFEQNLPRRQVAVKVMLPEVVNEQVRRMFRVEADLMAALSAHPSILTVYQAGVSSDGRPYLVMELCSSSLGQRYRSDPLPVAEVLRIGVKIAGALQTAHQQGILHRDVKPSNILLTAYGAPVLSDFGISSGARGVAPADAVGLSIPWSAPEVVTEATSGTVASEVWALGATLYSLLAGRSPFEVPGAPTAPGELARRIVKSRLPGVGRADVPASLEEVLARALSKDPARRQQSVLELLRELQAVEIELGLSPTPAEVTAAEWATGDVGRDPADRTVLAPQGGTAGANGVGGADASASPGSHHRASGHDPVVARGRTGPRRARRSSPTRSGSASVAGSTTGAPAGAGATRAAGSATSGPGGGARRRRRPLVLAVSGGVAVLVLAAVAAGVVIAQGQGGGAAIPRVGEIAVEAQAGGVRFSWADPGLEPGDSYRVTTGDGRTSLQRQPEFVAATEGGERVCISVAVVRAGKAGDSGAERCADSP